MKIIVPLQPRSTSELEILLPKLNDKVDIVEIWLDVLVPELMFAPTLIPLVQKLLEKARTKLDVQYLGVCKFPNEKGGFPGNKEERIQVLEHFLQLGGDFVDLDILQNSAEHIQRLPSEQLWLSCHDFKSIPENLSGIQEQMEIYTPAVKKFAVTPTDEADLENFLNFAKSTNDPTIYTTMGEHGAAGREALKPYTYGAFYALCPDKTTASGQPLLSELQE